MPRTLPSEFAVDFNFDSLNEIWTAELRHVDGILSTGPLGEGATPCLAMKDLFTDEGFRRLAQQSIENSQIP